MPAVVGFETVRSSTSVRERACSRAAASAFSERSSDVRVENTT
jgi:hypothetical protein